MICYPDICYSLVVYTTEIKLNPIKIYLCLSLPKYIMVFMSAIEFQFKSRKQKHNHDSQAMVKHPCTKTCQM